MLSSCLLYGVGISGISTGIYAVLTYDKDNINNQKDKSEYGIIFSTILFVSIIILYITGGSNQSLIPKNNMNTKTHMNNTPPF